MSLIINPGSGPVAAGEGWTNTYERAEAIAQEWYDTMRNEGLCDIAAPVHVGSEDEGRWRFGFTHEVTGVTVFLDTHGVDDLDAYEKAMIFGPRQYWNGSSSSDPHLSDWAAPGFVAVKTFRQGEQA